MDIVAVNPIGTTKRRWLALLLLTMTLAQVNWGCLILGASLQGWLYAAYWLLCVATALAALGLAVTELIASWRIYRQDRLRCRRAHKEFIE